MSWINGGFFVMKRFLKLIKNDKTYLEESLLKNNKKKPICGI